MNRFLSRRSVCAILLTMVSLNLSADDSVDFNRDIRPLMSSNCLTCHGPDEAERAADLRLDTEQGSRQDLGGYAAVVPGDPDASELVVRLTTDDEDLLMPPEGKGRRLSEEEVDLIRRWIRQGAAYARHWAYQRPTRRPLPSVGNQDWPRNPIDHFILSRLESEGLQPSAEADRLTLARRAALDLTGLPPTWQQAMGFVNDERENAYELYVDQLLAQEAFGERWARVWLDLARYADSAGYADDPPRTIWAYRDYVIRSLNDNKPFDQFTIEQIAGDLMPEPSDEQLLATAFHRNTLTNNEGGTNDEEFRNVAIIDRVNTTMAVWMGTTIACAQCHTHKYDPITQQEYFRFFALFNNSQDSDQRDERPLLSLWSEQQEQQKASWSERVSELNSLLRQSTPELERAQHAWLENARSQPQWLTLTPDSAVSKQQRELVVGEDAWVHGRGDGADRDAYTLTIPTTDFELVGLRLEVGAEQTDNFVLTGVTANWTPAATESLPARYVRVELPGKNRILHVAEIEAFRGDENVAAAGTATQSSTDFGGEARFANDSTTDGNFREHTTTHTATEDDPWLEIDLTQLSVIDRVVVWNRSDGGSSISDRLKGFKLVLLDERREVIWEHSPDEVPAQRGDYSARGAVPLKFDAAIVDYHQQGFPAESLIAGKPDNATGWAIGGATGKPHDLTLLMREPRTLGVGTLTIQLDQASVHAGHLLDQFRISSTADSDAAQWAAMPVAIRELVRAGNENLDQGQLAQLAEYYRGIALELEPLREEKSQLEKKLREIKPHTTVPVMRELPEDKRRVTKVQVRGNYLSTTDEVTAGTPVAFHPLPDDRPRDRMALARWLVDKENPLTPRVIANRHWEQIFGIGMVETSEEFGSQGELPSHPELLDWLAAELRDSGWDLKALLKLMVTSATYRQSSITTESLIEADPQNRLLARGPRFRISAEMVRDQALYVSGLLSNKMYGKPVNPPQPELGLKAAFGSATDWKTSGGEDKYRRGVYTTWRRSSPYPSMAQFDAPNREVCTVRRIRTNTPLQALVTLNDPVYVEAAQSLARRMMAAGPSPRQRVQFGVRHCLIRDPKPQETERLVRLAEEATKQFAADPDQAMKMATVPIGPLPQGSDAAETAAWTVVGNVILNLDEMYMKR